MHGKDDLLRRRRDIYHLRLKSKVFEIELFKAILNAKVKSFPIKKKSLDNVINFFTYEPNERIMLLYKRGYSTKMQCRIQLLSKL